MDWFAAHDYNKCFCNIADLLKIFNLFVSYIISNFVILVFLEKSDSFLFLFLSLVIVACRSL
jgi:hypothetical protein